MASGRSHYFIRGNFFFVLFLLRQQLEKILTSLCVRWMKATQEKKKNHSEKGKGLFKVFDNLWQDKQVNTATNQYFLWVSSVLSSVCVSLLPVELLVEVLKNEACRFWETFVNLLCTFGKGSTTQSFMMGRSVGLQASQLKCIADGWVKGRLENVKDFKM